MLFLLDMYLLQKYYSKFKEHPTQPNGNRNWKYWN